MKHLAFGECDEEGYVKHWCGLQFLIDDSATDPRDADCTSCLREAAEYGAAAAMRCAAVESIGAGDDELRQDRDHALRQLSKLERAMYSVGFFLCPSCDLITKTEDAGMLVPIRLCRACTA